MHAARASGSGSAPSSRLEASLHDRDGVGEEKAGSSGASSTAVELNEATIEGVAMDVQRDVLLQLYTARGCEACEHMVVYYNK